MSKFEARQCDNPKCGSIVAKDRVVRFKIEAEGSPLTEPLGVTKEMCTDCTEEFVDTLTTGNGWEPVKRRKQQRGLDQPPVKETSPQD